MPRKLRVMPLSESHLVALRALLDRLIPADEHAGALAAGVDRYVLGQLARDCCREAAAIGAGLTQLDLEAANRARTRFAELSAVEQDELLRELEAGRAATGWPAEISGAAFMQRVIELAHEGFYADPGNGGNEQAVSWQMIGYAPHLPRRAEHRSKAPPEVG